MGQNDRLTPEERARITEIQEFLIDRYVEQNEALEKGNNVRAKEIGLGNKRAPAREGENQRVGECLTRLGGLSEGRCSPEGKILGALPGLVRRLNSSVDRAK